MAFIRLLQGRVATWPSLQGILLPPKPGWALLQYTLLGLAFYLSPWMLLLWTYAVLGCFLLQRREQQLRDLPYLLFFLLVPELLGRVMSWSPYIPWESGKYLATALLLYGIYLLPNRRRGRAGWLFLLLLLPGISYTLAYESDWYHKVVFNGLGPVSMGLGMVFFANRQLTQKASNRLLWYAGLTIWSMQVYVLLASEVPTAVQYTFKCTYEVCAGFNPNQVCTLLATGAALLALPGLLPNVTRENSLRSLLFLVLISYSWLSFSRGGTFVTVAVLLAMGFWATWSDYRLGFGRMRLPYLLWVLPLLVGSFWICNEVSRGALLDRYQGERPDIEEVTLNSYTSNRSDIMYTDWKMLTDHPWTGVGVGNAPRFRRVYGIRGFGAQTELTRLMGEHGIPGLLAGLLFVGLPVYLFFTREQTLWQRCFLLLCFGLAVGSSMHSAMRTLVTPLFYALAFVRVVD